MAVIYRIVPASMLAALLVQAPAFAADSSGQKSEPKRQIEEVTVTAERKESSVQDTAISISAFTSETLKEFGIKNQTDLQNMVPATVILPYDAAIRGVGRNFRSLGGDPGIATYVNNVYSEDLYTATIGSLWDIQRVEILRGPQGTLYGRNAVGGAMNFIYKEPTDQFEGAVKGTWGNHRLGDSYLAVSGPLIAGKLDGRLTISDRTHDGWIQERGVPNGPNLDSGDEANVAAQLEWTPRQDISLKLRSNYAKVDRVMGGADGGGLVMFYGSSVGGQSRDFTDSAFGFRAVDATETDPTMRDYVDPTMQVFTFTNPVSGAQVTAQHLRAGVDAQQDTTGALGVGFPNYGYGESGSTTQCLFYNKSSIKGSDLCATTNGLNNETFDQNGNEFQAEWDVHPGLTLKYIFGSNSYIYRRITDDDKTYNANMDREFYVNHEMETASHELQAFWDVGEDLTFTSGVFGYHATIDQRGDFFPAVPQAQFTQPDPFSEAIFGAGTMVGLFTARDQNPGLPDCLTPGCPGGLAVATGAWDGDPGGTAHDQQHGPDTVGTDLLYATNTNRHSFAAYTQGVWTINDKFTLTFGARYAEDKLYGEENLFRYTEGFVPAAALCAAAGICSLADLNVARGALDPVTLKPTGANYLLNAGIPLSLSVHRQMHRKDTKWTYRLNLDWQQSDNIRWYANVTTGYRAGGYNLVFFSYTPTYKPEELIAYEIGYKGQHLDNTLQVNASIYLYDYSTIHTFGAEPSATGGVTTSVLPAPGARISGFEADVLWLATDHWTFGGNISITPSKYTKDFYLSNVTDPRAPNSLFNALSITYDLKGNQLLNVPRYKGNVYASYMIPLEAGNVEFLVNGSWISKVYNSPFQDEIDASPAYKRIDTRVSYTSNDNKWVVTAFVNNISDEIGIRQIEAAGEDSGFIRTGQTTEPRSAGLEFTYKMGGYE